MYTAEELHPADIRLFKTVKDAMRYVAKEYHLPLKSVSPMPRPELGNNFGHCDPTGDIQIVLRSMTNGKWDDEPFHEDEVWDTAAHELAHLRYSGHGDDFCDFRIELKQAMENRRLEYGKKIIEKLVKMQELRQGEMAQGNTEAAENFAAMINKMLLEHELNPSDLDYARGADNDPVIEVYCDLAKYRPTANWRREYQAEDKKTRIAWQESLASVVARGHLCHFLVQLRSNQIIFVGTKSHATVAEYVYCTLVHAATRLSVDANYAYNKTAINKQPGYRNSWLNAFVTRIQQRLEEARKAAVVEVSPDPNVQKTALMRLNGAMVKTNRYMVERYGRAAKTATALKYERATNIQGVKDGIKAADAMQIGRRGLDPSKVRGNIGDGK